MRSKFLVAVILAGIALVVPTFNLNSVAAAGLMDQIQKLAGQSPSSTATSDASTAVPLGKFAASGRMTETLDNGACVGSAAASGGACTPATNCVQLQFRGPVSATGLGDANLSACMTFDTTAVNPTFSSCFAGLGTGTITGKQGKSSIILAMGGLACIADMFPLPSPTNLILVVTSSYAVEGGSGRFVNGVGSGNVSLSALAPGQTMPPFSATGQVNITGTLAKQ